MFGFINIPARILAILELNVSASEIAGGVCLGMFLGFIPLNGPMAALLFILFFIFKINRLSTVLTLPLFKLVYALGGAILAERLGGYLLIDAGFLNSFWAHVTNLPILVLLDLNNTLVVGGLAFSFIFILPVYITSRFIYAKFIEKRLIKIQGLSFVRRVRNIGLAKKAIK